MSCEARTYRRRRRTTETLNPANYPTRKRSWWRRRTGCLKLLDHLSPGGVKRRRVLLMKRLQRRGYPTRPLLPLRLLRRTLVTVLLLRWTIPAPVPAAAAAARPLHRFLARQLLCLLRRIIPAPVPAAVGSAVGSDTVARGTGLRPRCNRRHTATF